MMRGMDDEKSSSIAESWTTSRGELEALRVYQLVGQTARAGAIYPLSSTQTSQSCVAGTSPSQSSKPKVFLGPSANQGMTNQSSSRLVCVGHECAEVSYRTAYVEEGPVGVSIRAPRFISSARLCLCVCLCPRAPTVGFSNCSWFFARDARQLWAVNRVRRAVTSCDVSMSNAP